MPRRRKANGADQPQPTDGGDDARPEMSNSALRADTIRSAARWLAEHEAEVKLLREEIAAYKQTHIKGDLGFKLSDWNTLYRFYSLEDDDRAALLDTIREGFAALGVGEQGSFLDAMDPQPAAAPKQAQPNPIAREIGFADGLAGVQDHADRYAAGEAGHGDYALGWADGQEQRERAAGLAADARA